MTVPNPFRAVLRDASIVDVDRRGSPDDFFLALPELLVVALLLVRGGFLRSESPASSRSILKMRTLITGIKKY